jgi:hypothetical protein
MNWIPPEPLKKNVDNYFFASMWYDWSLVEFLETKKSQILAGLQKVAVHHSYKRDLQSILESEPPEEVTFAIMKQLTQKITESEEVKMFWKAITAEKKYMEQLTKIRVSASFESVSLCALHVFFRLHCINLETFPFRMFSRFVGKDLLKKLMMWFNEM